jgi:hypothetical protein
MKWPYGTGHIYEKPGAYYGRWRTPGGRLRNRRLGPIRERGSSQGLTRAMAERALRKAQKAELAAVPSAEDAHGRRRCRCAPRPAGTRGRAQVSIVITALPKIHRALDFSPPCALCHRSSESSAVE